MEGYREQLRRDGYLVVPGPALGLRHDFGRHVVERYFQALHRDREDVHPDRGRLRSVFRYTRGIRTTLREQAHVDIVNRNHSGVRRYPRVELGHDPVMLHFVRTALNVLPADAPRRSTFSLNLFRTRTAVTMSPHQDHERYVVVHVLRKIGAGAHTILYDAEDRKVVTELCLEEGDTMFLEDRRFFHYVTPLIGTECERDALVCTVDHPETYGLEPRVEPGKRQQTVHHQRT